MFLDKVYVKPSDTLNAHYDKNKHMWVLNASFLRLLNPNLSDDELSRKAERYSRHIYAYLYRDVVATFNKRFVEWLISCTEQGKEIMLEALVEQAEADADSGIDSLSLSSPVDLTNGVSIDEKTLRNGSIAVFAKDTLNNAYVEVNGAKYYFNKGFRYNITFGAKDYERYEY